jgi:uncharacterized protein YjiS (DUF1127 family)
MHRSRKAPTPWPAKVHACSKASKGRPAQPQEQIMTLSITRTSTSHGTKSFSAALMPAFRQFAAFWHAMMREIRIRRDLRMLSSFSDEALQDMGLARGGLEDAIRRGRSESV